MGFMSRKVLPACASICVFCPALRARSRQPVKRYKKLIIDIFQDSSPNDRKISKLCDYAAKNPSRLPEIARMLEHRGYKAIRNIQLGAIRILVAVYTKLFSACQVQMSFLAVSAIDIIRSLLDEHQEDEIRILGCSLLFEFAHNQIDGTYVYQLESLLSNLCVLAKENGPEQRQRQLRSSGLRGLSAMLRFMGEHLHMPSEYDDVVSAVLCNYELSYIDVDSSASAIEKPGFWAQSCVEKISEFCKEATTTRRYLEPIFFYFDAGKHWSSRQGLAFTVLQQILHFMESFGNNCFLLAVLVRHLDHKSVSQEPLIKAQIVSIAASLTQQSTSEVTVVKVSVLSDMLRHLRNVLMASMDASLQPLLGDYTDFQLAIQKFLSELMKNIGSPSPIFEAMALTLENLSSTSLFSQSTMYSLLILGSIMAAQPLIIPNQQSFPEALLQQLSLAMVHPDSDTRLCAHRIFETILSSVHISEDTSNISVLSDQLAMPGVGFGSGLLQDTTQLHCKSRRDLDLNHEFESAAIRFTEDQLALLFSAVWMGSSLDNNVPGNYEAKFFTFTQTLQLSPARKSKDIFAKSFQLSLSIRAIAIEVDGHLSPSRKRSLYLLSSAMLGFVSKFYNISGILNQIGDLQARSQEDPFLAISNCRLVVRNGVDSNEYGTPIDNAAASELLEQIRKETDISTESLVSLILNSSSMISELDLAHLKNNLLEMFSPVSGGWAFDFNAHSNRARPWVAVVNKSSSFDEAVDSKDNFTMENGADFSAFSSNRHVLKHSDIIGVSQLLKSALEMAGTVAKVSSSTASLPFSAVTMKCEDLDLSAKRKMPVWANIDESKQLMPSITAECYEVYEMLSESHGKDGDVTHYPSINSDNILQLPPVSHYDYFLRAARC
ncbi:hypothetical protein KP509_09G088600 [Ceratopteris richardii]|uniref:ARM repeat superfamily protein n=1 Tax=Ceratopteris richardii TaxID=49495 RepID=A0A8T2U6N6_CERRI|nr:hypothetical protein KP509_09G088600 [Ceratopteris richardii]